MKKRMLISVVCVLLVLLSLTVTAQCSLCTKTASQLGEKPALGLNQAIVYLMMSPFVIVGIIAYRWWKNNKDA